MTTIRIQRQHDLPPDELRRRLDQLAQALGRELELQHHWEGERLVFQRSGASGHITVREGEIELELRLGLLLRPLQGHIRQAVERRLDKELPPPGTV